MRFSIRDLMWLMVVMALAATLYSERMRIRLLTARWEQASAKQSQQNAAAQSRLRKAIDRWKEQCNILQHQIVVHLEREQRRDAEDAARQQARVTILRPKQVEPLPFANIPDEAAE